jgi:hypothetical protein
MKDKQMEGVETEDGGNREHEQSGKGATGRREEK